MNMEIVDHHPSDVGIKNKLLVIWINQHWIILCPNWRRKQNILGGIWFMINDTDERESELQSHALVSGLVIGVYDIRTLLLVKS